MKNRHEKEFIALARSNEKLIYKVCSFYVSPTAPVEDLYQEVIANLWHSWPRFRGESALSTWIYRVALNTCITYMRKGKKKRAHETQVDNVPEPAADHDGGEDNVATLYKLINTLNDMDKAVILLYLEDKSYQEIAEITGLSPGNVGVRLNRIKNKLKSKF